MVDFFAKGADAFASQLIRAAIEHSHQIQLSKFTLQQASTEKTIAQRLFGEAVALRIQAEEKEKEASTWLQSVEEKEKVAEEYLSCGRGKIDSVEMKVAGDGVYPGLRLSQKQKMYLLKQTAGRIAQFEGHYGEFGCEMNEDMTGVLGGLRSVYEELVLQFQEEDANQSDSIIAEAREELPPGGEPNARMSHIDETTFADDVGSSENDATFMTGSPQPEQIGCSISNPKQPTHDTNLKINARQPGVRTLTPHPFYMSERLSKLFEPFVGKRERSQSIVQPVSKSSAAANPTTIKPTLDQRNAAEHNKPLNTTPLTLTPTSEKSEDVFSVTEALPSKRIPGISVSYNQTLLPRTVQPVPKPAPCILWDFAFPYDKSKLSKKGKETQQFSEIHGLAEKSVLKRTIILVSEANWARMTKTWLTRFGSVVQKMHVSIITDDQNLVDTCHDQKAFNTGVRSMLVCQISQFRSDMLHKVDQVFWINLKGKDQSHTAQKSVIRDVVNNILDSKSTLTERLAVKVVFAVDERSIARMVMYALRSGYAECKIPLYEIEKHFPRED